ncbi:UNKNOWN [Stylonychia lemnae]|uniref:Uncharacterized protein n=1 Tax=Stylonychia lemnae TaxID=5949 RepID=A0A077ZSJ9_STYLE|nr:UNKNOWN [Stylonychia lemnae]|eukprot:CDW72837.1 UNKNOWN [Stylonychia lemnae]
MAKRFDYLKQSGEAQMRSKSPFQMPQTRQVQFSQYSTESKSLNSSMIQNNKSQYNTPKREKLNSFIQMSATQQIDDDLSYFKSKFARYPQAVKLLKEIGFKQGSNTQSYVFGYDQTFPKMIIAKELLMSRVIKSHEEAAVFVRQTFSDQISKADLCDANSEYSKIARNLIPIDIMQAKGIRKNTNGRLTKIDDAIYMMIEREAFKQQNSITDIEDMDNMIYRGLLNREKVQKFWQCISELMMERISRKPFKKRAFVKDEDIQHYCSLEDPQIDIDNLSNECRIRIENIEELIELKTRMKVDRKNGKQLELEYLQKAQDRIWDPKTWFFQKQLVDDFVLYTMINNICHDNNIEMAFNLRATFRNFIMDSNLPDLNQSQQQQDRSSKLLMIKEGDRPLTIQQQYEQKESDKGMIEKVFGSIFHDEWKFLYLSMSPIIIHSCVLNDHFDKLMDGLHFINGAFLDSKDKEGRTPIELAILNTHIQDENSCTAILLNHKSPLSEQLWSQLLIFSLDKDLEIYPNCSAKKIIKLLGELFGTQNMRRIGLTPDSRKMTAIDYAKTSEDQELIDLVSVVMGEQILRDRPKSLQELEGESRINGLNYLLSDPFKDKNIDKMAITMKEREKEIFNRQTQPDHVNLLPKNYLEQKRNENIKRDAETKKLILEMELEQQKIKQIEQQKEFDANLKKFQLEMESQHKVQLDMANKVMNQKEKQIDQLKNLLDLQRNQMMQLQEQFQDLQTIKDRQSRMEEQKELQDQLLREQNDKSQSLNSSQILSNRQTKKESDFNDPFKDNEKLSQAYSTVKKNLKDVKQQVKQSQSQIDLLEREREAFKHKNSKACNIF